jgi:tetratricopeptide (TPR) repeat protein
VSRKILLPVGVAFLLTLPPTAHSDDPASETPKAEAPKVEALAPEADPAIKSTAVALNYCRASFHRIRQSPNKAVLFEEQEKILNNINLSAVSDPEIITLYTSVLDEVNQVGVADYERKLLNEGYRSDIQRKLAWNALAFGTDLATAQFGSAVRNGANSWWDYRTSTVQRDVDILKVDKARMTAVMSKSSQFLDTFWKLAQKKKIPDRWLVRGDDLDSLNQAVREPNAQVRLRVMKRMSPFMEAYPPYWYYLGRTYQELGQTDDAINTYEKLVALGDRHFRKDDMLATGLANKAAIEEFLGRSEAVATATRALEYSTEVWEANLVCARVLQRHRQFAAAEDAVLRNLDVGLEAEQSRVFLVSVYYHAEDRAKLVKTLSDPRFSTLPTPVLIRCASLLGTESTPPAVLQTVAASIDAQPRVSFGPDEVVLRASDAWQLPLAKMKATLNGRELAPAHAATISGGHELRLAPRKDLGHPFASTDNDWQLRIELTYPDASVVALLLSGDVERSHGASTRVTAFRDKRISLANITAHDTTPSPAAELEAPLPQLLPIESDPASE